MHAYTLKPILSHHHHTIAPRRLLAVRRPTGGVQHALLSHPSSLSLRAQHRDDNVRRPLASCFGPDAATHQWLKERDLRDSVCRACFSGFLSPCLSSSETSRSGGVECTAKGRRSCRDAGRKRFVQLATVVSACSGRVKTKHQSREQERARGSSACVCVKERERVFVVFNLFVEAESLCEDLLAHASLLVGYLGLQLPQTCQRQRQRQRKGE
jgi:hypothetical protein